MIESILSIASGGLSGAAVAFLLKTWLRTKIENDIRHTYDTKLARLKSELQTEAEKGILSHQNEFELYQRIWEPLAKVRLTCDGLSEAISRDDSERKKEKVVRKGLEELALLLEAIEYNKPFLPAELCRLLEGFAQTCLAKMADGEHESFSVDSSYERIANAIRKRIRMDADSAADVSG